VRRLKASPIVIPDGPGGPPYEFKEGVIHLARLAEVPIVAMGFAADRYWTVGSWDRLMIPRPFARVSIVIRPPEAVPASLSEGQADTVRSKQERALNEATRAAERSAGMEGSIALPV